MKDTFNDSDAESFHSARSSTNKKAAQQTTMPEARPAKKCKCRRSSTRHMQDLNSLPDGLTSPSPEECEDSSEMTDQGISRPGSSRSRRRRTNPSTPRRQSSTNFGRNGGRRHSSRRDPTTLHRQSCRLFSSLDGMLVLSREFTPLPSVSTTRTATRHASLVPDDTPVPAPSSRTEMERQLCHTVDEKLKAVKREHQTRRPYRRVSLSSASASASASSSPSPAFRHSYSDSSLVYQSHVVSPRISTSVSDVDNKYGRQESTSGGGNDARRPPLNAVISWTSNATRREEYEKIDRAHSGFRGFLRKMLPKCMHSKNARRAFYAGAGGDGDSDSVRRFRMSLDDSDDDDDDADVDDDHGRAKTAAENENEKANHDDIGGVDDHDDDDDDSNDDTLDMDEKQQCVGSRRRLAVTVSAAQPEPGPNSTSTATTTSTTTQPPTEGKKHRWTCFQ
ncbi:hypothetical protein PV08_01897 [Exophiala spinifera]|uniref:Uncharacterized protein n=1 Tax=Exophiala spinifera TaxID=91928 RepID=A0A0D2A954_9EURO|nr:uncharacterized protein PV08_01897 [Exophiala spinifera]KIW21317.1 hypothetical protein PV08_01897 [Exophiala spinifera]